MRIYERLRRRRKIKREPMPRAGFLAHAGAVSLPKPNVRRSQSEAMKLLGTAAAFAVALIVIVLIFVATGGSR